MAKNRMVSTQFWNDNYASNLDPIEKLLFLYLLTNERSTLAGVYELPKKIMAVETGIETEMVSKILGRFEIDGKLMSRDGWIAIKNFKKHHESGSPTVQKGIELAIESAPQWAKDFIEGKGIDTLSPSASASASAFSSGASAPRILEGLSIQEEAFSSEQESPGKKPAKYPNKVEVYDCWGKWPLNWKINTAQCKAAENLFKERGLSQIRGAIAFWRDHKDEQFIPDCSSPYQLDSNWSKLFKYKTKNGL